ncbi:hypothetical protein PYCC9005_001570 [Savitreella phatthalungensis]
MTQDAWRRRSIYQLLTDRFAPTQQSGEVSCDYAKGVFCGGTWQGVIRRLDHIQSMGFDAVWISPVVKNIEDFTTYGYGWHGYWAEDLTSLNPHFGTNADLLALSDALHARGMALMVDIVINHMGSTANVDYSRYRPFNSASQYHPQQLITDYSNQTLVEQGWLGDPNVPLPDIDTENVDNVKWLNSWINSLVQTYRIDGLRLDTVKHVRKDFWPAFIAASGVFCIGEVFSGDPNYLSAYQPYVGGLLDYATYYPLRRAFTAGGSMTELAALLSSSYRSKFVDTQLLGTFMENHDNPRFPAEVSSTPSIIRSAMAYTVLSDGIPVVYQGQEYGFSGGADPQNREYLWGAGWTQTAYVPWLTLLNKVRSTAWDAGFGTNLTSGLYSDGNTLAVQKGPLLMLLSNANVTRKLSLSTAFAPGTQLVDVVTCQNIIVGKTTNVTLSDEPRIFLPFGLARNVCPATQASSSLLSRIASVFSSSSRSASLAKSTQSSYNSGISTTPARGRVFNTNPAVQTSSSASVPRTSSQLQQTSSARPSAPSIFRASTLPGGSLTTTSGVGASRGQSTSLTASGKTSLSSAVPSRSQTEAALAASMPSASSLSSNGALRTSSTSSVPSRSQVPRSSSTSSLPPVPGVFSSSRTSSMTSLTSLTMTTRNGRVFSTHPAGDTPRKRSLPSPGSRPPVSLSRQYRDPANFTREGYPISMPRDGQAPPGAARDASSLSTTYSYAPQRSRSEVDLRGTSTAQSHTRHASDSRRSSIASVSHMPASIKRSNSRQALQQELRALR